MRLRELLRSVAGELVEHAEYSAGQTCMKCGGTAGGYADRRPVLCLLCTLRELKISEFNLALQVEFHISRNVLETRLEKFGPPCSAPKEWITAKSRLFR